MPTQSEQEYIDLLRELKGEDAAQRAGELFAGGGKPIGPDTTVAMPVRPDQPVPLNLMSPEEALDPQAKAIEKYVTAEMLAGTPEEEARDIAVKRVVEPITRGQTMEGAPAPESQTSRRDIRSMQGWEAMQEAFKRQVVLPGAERAEQKRLAEQIGASEREALFAEAVERVKEEEVPGLRDFVGDLGPGQAQFNKRVVESFHDSVRSRKPHYISHARDHFREYMGRDPENDEEVEDLGLGLYNQFVWGVAPNIARESNEEFTLRNVGMDILKAAGHAVDPETGDIVESRALQVLRDMVGLWRIGLNSAAKAASWEVDESGRPLDPDDLTLRVSKFLPEAWVEKPQIAIPTGTGAMVVPFPFGPSTRTSADAENPAIESGDYWTDVAWGIANSRFSGDDLMEITNYQQQWEDLGFPNFPYWAGVAVEFPLKLSPITPAAQLASKTGTAVSRGAAKAGMTRTAGVIGGISRPLHTIDRVRAVNAAGDAVRGLPTQVADDVAKAAPGGRHSTLSVASQRVADEIALPYHLAEGMPGSLRQLDEVTVQPYLRSTVVRQIWAETSKVGDDGVRRAEYGAVLRRLHAWRVTQKAARETGQMSDEVKAAWDIVTTRVAKVAPAAMDSAGVITTRLAKHARALKQAVPSMAEHELTALAYRATAKDAVAVRLAERVPDDMHFLTPFHLMSGKSMRALGPEIDDVMVDVMSDPAKIKEALIDAIGPHKASTSPFWKSVVKNIEEGGELSDKQKLFAVAEIKGDVAKRLVARSDEFHLTEVLEPDLTSALTRRAKTPAERRVPLVEAGTKFADITSVMLKRVSPDLAERMSTKMPALVREIARDWLPSMFPHPVGRTPMRTMAWIDEVDGLLQTNIEGFRREYASLIKAVGPEKAIQTMIDRTLKHAGMQDFKGGESVKRFLAWKSILTKFFGGAHVPDDAILKGYLKGNVKTGSVEGIYPITAPHVKAVIQTIRQADPSKQMSGKGLSSFGVDRFSAAMFAWMLEERAARVVDVSLSKWLGRNPEFRMLINSATVAKPAITAGALREAMERRGISEALRGSPAFEGEITGVVNNLMRNIAGRMSDADRFNILRMSMSRKIATGNVFETLDTMEALPRAVGQLLSRKFVGKELKNLGLADDVIPEVTEAVIDTVQGIIMRDSNEAMQQLLIRQGMAATGNAAQRSHIANRAIAVESKLGRRQMAMVYGKDAAEAIHAITAAAKNGSLDTALKALRASDDAARTAGRLGGARGVTDGLIKGLISLLDMSRRTTISGLLGGFPLPNTRFLGLNAITAPIIVALTVGPKFAFQSLGIGRHNRLYNWAAIKLGHASDVLFVRDGVKWTRKMVEDAIKRNNIRYSAISYEFNDVIIRDLERMARINSSLGPVSTARTIGRYLDPSQKNIWNRFAEQTDNYFRQNVFVSALIAGRTESEAAKLAQNALLDYGAVPPIERMVVNKVAYFYAFMRQITEEGVRTAIKDPNLYRRMHLLQRAQHRDAGLWAYEGDSEKQRMWVLMGDVHDNHYTTGLYGPHNPALMAFDDTITVLDYIMNNPTPVGLIKGAKAAASERLYNPWFDIFTALSGWHERGAEGRIVPDHILLAAHQSGMWDSFRTELGIVPAVGKDRRPGKVEVGGMQWKFHGKEDEERFLAWMALANMMGLKRNIEDAAKISIAAGLHPEDAKPKRLGDGSWAMVAGNVSTPLAIPDDIARQNRALENVYRELSRLRAR